MNNSGSYCDSQPGLLSVDEAMQRMKQQVTSQPKVEKRALFDAQGYILAEDLRSSSNVPPFNNSAMDGYAVNTADLTQQNSLTLIGASFAGQPFDGTLQTGQCIRIMTGAPIPDGADCVIMQEHTSVTGDNITFHQAAKQQQNIRPTGEDIAIGDIVLTAGTKLSAKNLPLLASLGFNLVPVFSRINIAVFSTGDELRNPGEPLSVGQIYDSNRIGVITLLKQLDVNVIDLGIIADNKALLLETIKHADLIADIVMSSGGVSVGEADYTKQVLEQLGQIECWKLAIKPGKPIAFGQLPNSLFFGLPGNPVSAITTLYQLAVPIIALRMGWSYPQPPRLLAQITHPLKKSPGRTEFQRGIFSNNAAGELTVTTTGHQGSGVFSSIKEGNCFIILEQERGKVEAAEQVWIEPFNALLS